MLDYDGFGIDLISTIQMNNKPTMHPQLQTLIEIIKHTVDQEIVSVILFGSAATGLLKNQ